MSRILVTGSTGFVGSALCSWLVSEGYDVQGISRRELPYYQRSTDSLQKNDVIVHTAAIAHRLNESGVDPIDEYRQVNRDLPLQLAKAAAKAGARRFIFLSTIKVLGEGDNKPYTEQSVPAPEGAYAISKWEAEQVLLELGRTSSIDVVILRPSLVYGPGVKGNLRQLIRVVAKGIPLPFGAVNNRRDFLSIYNLCDVIRDCIDKPVGGKTLLLADGESISTTRLMSLIAQHLGRPNRLVPVPVSLMRFFAMLVGKSEVANRLLGDFEIDVAYTKQSLDWKPRWTVDESFQKMLSVPTARIDGE